MSVRILVIKGRPLWKTRGFFAPTGMIKCTCDPKFLKIFPENNRCPNRVRDLKIAS